MKKLALALIFFSGFLVVEGCYNSLPEPLGTFSELLPEKVDFNFHIKPIISDRCFKCHGPDEGARKGNLRLDLPERAFANTNDPDSKAKRVLTARSTKKSELFHRINSNDDAYVMPPPESNLHLTDYEKALISKWIQQGAKYSEHWAYEAPEPPNVPKKNDPWITNSIDQFVLDKLEKQDLTPSKKADKTTLLRRASLDLTGLPPSIDEIETFLSDDSEDAYDRLIDRLLNSNHYGERMALEWLDVARYADTHGYQDDGMRTTWPWRDWVIDAYNKNLPFDDFVVWQLAGDLLDEPTQEQLLATCFNRNHPQTQEGGVVDEEYRVEYVADRTNTFGKAFLGLTMECARCHDHKYDPITQEEYYGLYAFFNNNNESGIVPYDGEASPTVFLPDPEIRIKLDSLGLLIDSLVDLTEEGLYTKEFESWYASLDDEPNVSSDVGLLADFSFEEELEADSKTMNLDKREPEQLPKDGKMVVAFYNAAKSKPDATTRGDVDKRPKVREGYRGNGLHFRGDSGIRFNRDLDLDRNQPFAVSIWIKPLRDSLEGPVFNNTNGAFEGYRGWLCKLNMDGTLSFQMNHVWPDNAIDIKTHEVLDIGVWTHIVMSYDGSSEAEGVQIFINGKAPEQTVLADRLYKSLLHGKNNSNWSDFPFILGLELNKTMEDMVMDELKVYKRQLSEIEVAALFSSVPSQIKTAHKKDLWARQYLLSGQNDQFNRVIDRLIQLREFENDWMTDEMEVMIMQERREHRPTYLLDRGMYDQPVKKVSPTVPSVFADNLQMDINSRLDLANWLVDEGNPLTARVAVNRLWKMLFGKGIVGTQEDFGSQGNLPSHVELLDWLALKFIALDWDVKALMKFIMTSSTYTQSSVASEQAKTKDPENRWYSHFPAHRLSAELIRDNALAASDLLVRKIGGPSVYPYQPQGLWKALATRNATVYKQQHGDSLYRRSMYTVWKRSSPPPNMMTFDAPDRYYCVVNRQKTSTPLQSLILMNDPQFLETSRVLAEKMILQDKYDPIDYAYLALVGRKPQEKERALLNELLLRTTEAFGNDIESSYPWISMGEYQSTRDLEPVKWASHTVLASTLMNYDEFVMKR